MLPRRSTVTLRSHLRALRNDFAAGAARRPALLTSMLGYQAWLMCDAIGRTLWRMFVSHRHLLEWIPADLLGKHAQFLRRLLRAHVPRRAADAGAVGAGHLLLTGGQLPGLALPFLLLWLAAPGHRLAHQPDAARGGASPSSTTEQQRELRLIARRTWRFFETFVTAEDNHLPPDNFQEDPRAVVAHRTSPTNIGLYLLSMVAARDFGWCGLRDALDRIEATLGTLARMHKLSRAPLQLVRHARPAAARTALRLVGRLGQPRRASDHARRRVPRMAEGRRRRRAEAVDGPRRRARPGARGIARIPLLARA